MSLKGKGGSSSKKGRGGKSRSGGGTIQVEKQREMKTSKAAQAIMILREAIYVQDGEDRDVLADFAPFCTYSRNGLDLTLEFLPGKTFKRDPALFEWAVELTSANMADCEAWYEYEAQDELEDNAGRHIIVRDRESGDPVGFAHFRFTLQGELHSTEDTHDMSGNPICLVYDIQLTEGVRRKGLGKHLMQIFELVCRKYQMSFLQARVHRGNDAAAAFFSSKLKGFEVETPPAAMQAAEMVEELNFDVLSKCTNQSMAKKQTEAAAKQAEVLRLAQQLAQQMSTGATPTKAKAAAAPAPPAAAAAAGSATATAGPADAQQKS